MLDLAGSISCVTIDRTVSDGIAKPTPSLPPDSLSICALTPITRPWPSRSGPPELPWLIAASVWIESLIVKLFGAVIWRWRADDAARHRALEAERAAHGDDRVADGDIARVAEPERVEERLRRVDLDHGEVGRGSVPTSRAECVEPSQNRTESELAPSTTCWFVTTWPTSS